MKKVLVFGMTENPGGIESVIMNYYRNIDRNKYSLDFVCISSTMAYYDEVKKLGGNIYFIHSKRKNYVAYKKEIKKIFEKKYDIIWYNTCNLNNIDYLKIAKKNNIKYRIVHAHNSKNMGKSFVEKLYNFVSHNLNKLIVKKYANLFWSCSKEASKYFYSKKIIESKSYRIINNAIDTSKFKYNEKIKKEYLEDLKIEDKIVIGNVGRLHFQKNQEFIIDVFNELNKKSDKYVLLLVGQGPDEEKLKKKVNELRINKSVKFLGLRSDIPNLFSTFDLFLFPSKFEGLPVTLIEAESSGVNIITSYEAFPEDSNMVENIKRLYLNDSIDKWVREIQNMTSYNKDRSLVSDNNIKLIKKRKFDIKEEAKHIFSFCD